MSQRGPGPVPHRWLYCPRKSDTIIAERFLAFKTPLSRAFNDQMPLECVFPPEMIFDYCKTIKLKLGLWIDLTNTKRFYDRSVVEDRGAQFVKLQCRGHGETPSREQTKAFIEIVHNFINERPFDIIAVHCTHGFNRTGFLIACYLVEHLDCSVEAALSMFAEARKPGIYKQDYINELFRRYEGEEDAYIRAPELPSWCLEYDDSNNDGALQASSLSGRKRNYNDNDSSTSQQAEDRNMQRHFNEDAKDDESNNLPRKKRRSEMHIKNPQFMAGVPGITAVTDPPRLAELQHKVQDMCGWRKNGFPGSQPVSMDRNNIVKLHQIPYRVSWKADGTRYMMLINKRDEIYFFDRNHSCFQVNQLTFLKAGNPEEHLEDTLIDGEMVLDIHQGQTTPRYLIYDIIKLSKRDVGKEPFPDRLRYIKKEIIDPRYDGMMRGLINRSLEPFSVRQKEFWDISYTANLLGEKFAKQLLHEPDGLIFQPSNHPYVPGACPDVFKWKPSEMNSVDFRLKIIEKKLPGMLPETIGVLYVGGTDEPFTLLAKKPNRALRELDNKIIECTVNGAGQWEFMRERPDKKMPNSLNTAKAVLKSITNPVTKDYLLAYIKNFGYRDDHDMMPPPQSSQQSSHQRRQH